MKYIQALETNYNDSIRVLKEKNEKLVKQLRNAKSERFNEASEKSEFESLFVNCIEEVRKEVMRRRFRSEIANRKSLKLKDSARSCTSEINLGSDIVGSKKGSTSGMPGVH